ncbi:MAG: hypothetical protein CMH83_15955 [Nocardioides sp.]|nr:hypothetical protein [Nocardioides sp.]
MALLADDQVTNAVVALALGSGLAVLLLLPVAWVQYRRLGRLGPVDLGVLLAAAVYGLALWTYTLLPTPVDDYACLGARLDPRVALDRATAGTGEGGLSLLTQPGFLQVALNVALFVPLGFFVRRVLRRGVLVAAVLGLATSLAIETTQLTGVWGLFPCAYRLFDTADLVVNTAGAVVGSLASVLVLGRRPDPGPDRLPRRVTLGRRLMGMACDLLFLVLASSAVGLLWRAWELWLTGTPERFVDEETQARLQWIGPLAIEVLWVLIAGRTVGEHVVAVRAVPRRRRLAPLSRLVKLATGVGGLFGLLLVREWWGFLALATYALLTLLVAWRSTGHRGLSHVLAGMDLVPDDAGAPTDGPLLEPTVVEVVP